MELIACEVCGADGPKLCWDHNHDTGYVQGVLCSRCNTAKGFLQEDVTLVERLAQYMRQPATSILYNDLCRERDAAWMRQKRSDPEYRILSNARNNAQQKARYASDPEMRAKAIARATKWNKDNGYVHQRKVRKGT